MKSIPREVRALVWRDARQLLPLVAMLVVVTTLVSALWLFTNDNFDGFVPSVWIPLILPALLAAGCGAILVGNEKETRTLKWTASLPVQPCRVFQSKLLVATAALIVMWLAAIGLLVGMCMAGSESLRDFASLSQASVPWSFSFWIVHTIFILVTGLYAAWRIENVFGSLIAMIPIASVPIIAAASIYKCYSWLSGQYYNEAAVRVLATWITMPAIGLMVWLCHRAAIRFFTADPPPRIASSAGGSGGGLPSWRAAWQPPAAALPASKPFRISLATLVWQSVHQNRIAVIGLSACVVLGMICLALTGTQRSRDFVDGGLDVMWGLGFLAVSWLGVLSFANDGSSKSLKFLADRGISPSRVWLGRHLMPIAAVSAALLAYGACQRLILVDGYLRDAAMLSLAAITATVLVIYGVSQWTSMTVRILGGSAFLAPLLSGVCAGWLVTQWMLMGSPIWVMAVCIALPYAVTLMMMKHHMEDRRDFRFWLTNIAAIAVGMIGLPIAHCVYQIRQFPTISTARRAEMQSMAMKVGATPVTSVSITRVDWGGIDYQSTALDGKPTGVQLAKRLETTRGRPADWIELDHRTSLPLRFDINILEASIGSAEYYRFQMIDDPSEVSIEQFEAWCEFLIQYGQRMRLSSRLWDQEGADQVEIWLTATYAKSEMQEFRGLPTTNKAMQLISNAKARNQARRRAVLASWTDYRNQRREDDRSRPDFGGCYGVLNFPGTPEFQIPFVVDRGADVIASVALKMIDAGANGASTMPMRKTMHQLIYGNDKSFASGPYSDRSAILASSPDSSGTLYDFGIPTTKWYGPWEQEAMSLYREWQQFESNESQEISPEAH